MGRGTSLRARSEGALAGGSTPRTSTTRCRRPQVPGRSRRRKGRRRRRIDGRGQRMRTRRRKRRGRRGGGSRRRGGRTLRRWTHTRRGASRRRSSRRTLRAGCMGTVVRLRERGVTNGMDRGGRTTKTYSITSSRWLAWARMDGEDRRYGLALHLDAATGVGARRKDERTVEDDITDFAVISNSFTTPAVRCGEEDTPCICTAISATRYFILGCSWR